MRAEKRVNRLEILIAKLESGKQVNINSLKVVLLPQEFEKMQNDWTDEKSGRIYPKPEAIKIYELKLRTGNFYYSKMDRYSSTTHKNAALALEYTNKALVAFENALEYLTDSINQNSTLRMWIDEIQADKISLEPYGMPMVNKSPHPRFSKRYLRIVALSNALDRISGKAVVELPETNVVNRRNIKRKSDFSGFKF